jgi:hypothetical protein
MSLLLVLARLNVLDEALWSMLEYNDDTYGIDDYINILEKMNSFNSECAIIEILIQDGRWNDALSRTQTLPNRVKLTNTTKREYDVLASWIQLLANIHTEGRDLDSMLPNEKQALEAIAQKFDTHASVQALELLNSIEANHFFVPPAFGRTGNTRSFKIEENKSSHPFITLFPNPADHVLEVQFKQALPTQQTCVLIILDAMGREIIQQTISPNQMNHVINTTKLANGFYVLQIIQPQLKLNIHEKFEVAR